MTGNSAKLPARRRRSQMKTFHCTHCDNLIFFENVRCLSCEHPLAFLPDHGIMAALIESPEGCGDRKCRAAQNPAQVPGYRLCANYDQVSVCNWAVPADDPNPLCTSCRLNRVIPDLSDLTQHHRLVPLGARQAPHALHPARPRAAGGTEERRMGIPGSRSSFWRTPRDGDAKRVLTGHDNGLITLNIAEADDVHREKSVRCRMSPIARFWGISVMRSAITSGID